MRRSRFRGWAWVGIALLGLLAWRVVAFTPARAIVLVDDQGRPVAGAYAAYHHRSAVFNFVDSLSVYAPGTLIRSDQDGVLHVPMRLALKHPAHSQPEARIHFLYAPSAHVAMRGVVGAVYVRGVLDIQEDGARWVVHSLEHDPQAWERALDALFSAIRYELWPDLPGRRFTAPPGKDEFAGLSAALEAEWAALRWRHGATPRQMPGPDEVERWPASDREERRARMQADIDALPTWGAYLDRHWADRMQALRREQSARTP